MAKQKVFITARGTIGTGTVSNTPKAAPAKPAARQMTASGCTCGKCHTRQPAEPAQPRRRLATDAELREQARNLERLLCAAS